jgi:hypothetical protein
MIFQYEYAQRGSIVSVDVFAGNDPEALEFCGTLVFPTDVMVSFQANAERDGNQDIHFVDLDKA